MLRISDSNLIGVEEDFAETTTECCGTRDIKYELLPEWEIESATDIHVTPIDVGVMSKPNEVKGSIPMGAPLPMEGSIISLSGTDTGIHVRETSGTCEVDFWAQ